MHMEQTPKIKNMTAKFKGRTRGPTHTVPDIIPVCWMLKIWMQDRIAAGNIEIRQAIVYLTEIQTVVKGILHLFPTHCIQPFAVIFGENIAVLTPLIALICDVPLKGKILFHDCVPLI